MSISNDGIAQTAIHLLSSQSCANTAAATSAYKSIAAYEGTLVVIQNVGTVTAGTIVGKLVHADDDSGTNVADITGATFTSCGTSTDETSQKIAIPIAGLKPYIGYVGTIGTGPAVVGVTALAVNKYI